MRTTKYLARTAMIAALYAAVTLIAAPIPFGSVQFRISEALTVLPLLYVEAVPGLAIGCLLANIASTPWDMLFGTTATLLAALATYFSRRLWIGVWPPIVFNMFLVPVVFLFMPDFPYPYWFNVLTVGLGQLGAVLLLGVPLYYGLKKAARRGLPVGRPSRPVNGPTKNALR